MGVAAKLCTDEVTALATGEPDRRINITLIRSHRDEIRTNGVPNIIGNGVVKIEGGSI